MNISITTCPEQLEEVFRFRYSVYVEEMNRHQRYADHLTQRIKDPLDQFGHVWVAHDDKKLVGTVRINLLREGCIGEYQDLYGLHGQDELQRYGTSITTRLMISRQYRSGTLAVRLSKAVFEFALANGIREDYIDCNAPLDQFFSRLGHRRVRDIEHPEYGNVVVMKLDLHDQQHLRSIRSPLSKRIDAPGFFTKATKNVYFT